MYICVYVYMYICVQIRIYKYTRIHVNVCVCVFVSIKIYIYFLCTYIFTCTQTAWTFNHRTDESCAYLDGSEINCFQHDTGAVAAMDCGKNVPNASYFGLGHRMPGAWQPETGEESQKSFCYSTNCHRDCTILCFSFPLSRWERGSACARGRNRERDKKKETENSADRDRRNLVGIFWLECPPRYIVPQLCLDKFLWGLGELGKNRHFLVEVKNRHRFLRSDGWIAILGGVFYYHIVCGFKSSLFLLLFNLQRSTFCMFASSKYEHRKGVYQKSVNNSKNVDRSNCLFQSAIWYANMLLIAKSWPCL